MDQSSLQVKMFSGSENSKSSFHLSDPLSLLIKGLLKSKKTNKNGLLNIAHLGHLCAQLHCSPPKNGLQ